MTYIPTFEQLDAIADAYIPALGVLAVFTLFQDRLHHGIKQQAAHLIALTLGVSWVYALMFADLKFGFWPVFNLDYSTHTALALCFIYHLNFIRPKKRFILYMSFIAYALLMLYQKYHSLADIITTALAVIPLLYCIYRMLHKRSGDHIINKQSNYRS